MTVQCHAECVLGNIMQYFLNAIEYTGQV